MFAVIPVSNHKRQGGWPNPYPCLSVPQQPSESKFHNGTLYGTPAVHHIPGPFIPEMGPHPVVFSRRQSCLLAPRVTTACAALATSGSSSSVDR